MKRHSSCVSLHSVLMAKHDAVFPALGFASCPGFPGKQSIDLCTLQSQESVWGFNCPLHGFSLGQRERQSDSFRSHIYIFTSLWLKRKRKEIFSFFNFLVTENFKHSQKQRKYNEPHVPVTQVPQLTTQA